MQILLIEDDRDLAANLIDFLESEGHELDYAYSLGAAEQLLRTDPPELFIVDRMLPDGDGLEFVKKLRGGAFRIPLETTAVRSLPVLFLTARDLESDKLDGFAAGGDDYVIKPFSLAELGARVLALGKRFNPQPADLRQCGSLQLDEQAKCILHQGNKLTLSPLQFTLLASLIHAFPKAIPRPALVEQLWPDDPPHSDSLKVHLHGLRQKLEPITDIEVRSERGQGIRLVIQA